MAKKIICFVAIFLITFGMCACWWDAGLPFLIDLEYEESAYDVSDVALRFSYGVKKSFIKDGLKDSGKHVYGDAHLFFTKTTTFVNYITDENTGSVSFDYSSPDIFLIKTIPREEFFSDEYSQSNYKGRSATFNHSEMITVPQELFTEDSGTIFFYLRIDRRERSSQFDAICFISFDYEFIESEIFITNVNLNIKIKKTYSRLFY